MRRWSTLHHHRARQGRLRRDPPVVPRHGGGIARRPRERASFCLSDFEYGCRVHGGCGCWNTARRLHSHKLSLRRSFSHCRHQRYQRGFARLARYQRARARAPRSRVPPSTLAMASVSGRPMDFPVSGRLTMHCAPVMLAQASTRLATIFHGDVSQRPQRSSYTRTLKATKTWCLRAHCLLEGVQ